MILFILFSLSEFEKTKFMYIYDNHAKRMIAIISHILGNDEHKVDTALSDAFKKIADNIERIDINNEMALKRYLYKIARSCAYDLQRDAEKQERISNKLAQSQEDVFACEVADIIEQEERTQTFLKEFAKLPEVYRELLIDIFYNNKTLREIADETNTPYTTVVSRRKSAIEKMRKILEESDFYDKI